MSFSGLRGYLRALRPCCGDSSGSRAEIIPSGSLAEIILKNSQFGDVSDGELPLLGSWSGGITVFTNSVSGTVLRPASAYPGSSGGAPLLIAGASMSESESIESEDEHESVNEPLGLNATPSWVLED
jgi:hypothetical protein